MHNCLILGSGRSGTSMLAGTLAGAGYFLGARLHPPRDTNPKGFFEDAEINRINEELLAPVVPRRPPLLGRFILRDRPAPDERWVARVPPGTDIPCPPTLAERIARVVPGDVPFCFKDPRFCYTLPCWRPYLRDVRYLCVFRDPIRTANSMLKECHAYLPHLYIDFDRAVEVWMLMYRHVLDLHMHEGDWLFLHFDQLLSEEGLRRLAAFTAAPIDPAFPDAALRRSAYTRPIPEATRPIYERLCAQAGYRDEQVT